jgi:hypothetical protein
VIVGVSAALLEKPGERGQEDNLEALQQTKQGHHIPEEQAALNMKFTIAILSDWQVTLLLTPDHVRDIIKKV